MLRQKIRSLKICTMVLLIPAIYTIFIIADETQTTVWNTCWCVAGMSLCIIFVIWRDYVKRFRRKVSAMVTDLYLGKEKPKENLHIYDDL